jgi:hypothetical protein
MAFLSKYTFRWRDLPRDQHLVPNVAADGSALRAGRAVLNRIRFQTERLERA